MKRTLFHGTTYDNYLKILEEGFNPSSMVWDCSNDNEMYFYDDSKDTDYILEYGDIEELHESLIRKAFESAQITASVYNPTDNRLVVFEVEVEEEYIEDDYSCENMSSFASCVNIDNLELSMIKNVYVSNDAYNNNLRFFYINGIYGRNDNLNDSYFTPLERDALEIISESEIYIEALMDFTFEKL